KTVTVQLGEDHFPPPLTHPNNFFLVELVLGRTRRAVDDLAHTTATTDAVQHVFFRRDVRVVRLSPVPQRVILFVVRRVGQRTIRLDLEPFDPDESRHEPDALGEVLFPRGAYGIFTPAPLLVGSRPPGFERQDQFGRELETERLAPGAAGGEQP